MIKVGDKLPNPGQFVVAYCPDDKFYFAVYTKALTWAGSKFKFVNLASKGFWHDDVIGWNRVPNKEETL